MAKRKLTKKQGQERQDWISHKIDMTSKREVKATSFEYLLQRLHLTEGSCTEHPAVIQWVKQHRNSRYVPERVLSALSLDTNWHADISSYSLCDGIVIPEPLQEAA